MIFSNFRKTGQEGNHFFFRRAYACRVNDTLAAPSTAPAVRDDYRLSDAIWAASGRIFLTGTQALVRLLVMQRQRDKAAGLDTRGFISGYRGSPLGMVDQAVWKAGKRLEDEGVRF